MQNLLAKLKAWMQQGTSILGASGALAVLTAWLLGQMNDKQAIAALIGCAISFALPQYSRVDATALAGAMVTKLTEGPPTKQVGAAPVAVDAKTA
jgi:hypothetical protein